MPPFAAPVRSLLALALALVYGGSFAADVSLRPATQLSPPAPKDKRYLGATHIEADRLEGRGEDVIVAEGRVIARNQREQMAMDWLRYDRAKDEVEARGNVVFTQDKDRLSGSLLKLKLTERLGELRDVEFSFTTRDDQTARGQAKALFFEGQDKYRLEASSYTTCPAGNQDWFLRTEELDLDYPNNLGIARRVRVEFKDTPIFYTPWVDFALDERRKSGFLAPSYGASDKSGLELQAPWYWNIAPNRDLTLYPRIMSKRGLQAGAEFRYLEPKYQGELIGEYLPSDQVTDKDRFRGYWRHEHSLAPHLNGFVELERVSDNNYFADLSRLINQTSQVNLPRQGGLIYDGDWWRLQSLVQSYQTLQDPAALIVPPYQRLPQIVLTASRESLMGSTVRFDIQGEYVRFDQQGGNPILGGQMVQGSRFYAYPSVSLPVHTPFSTITPKLGWHYSRYQIEDATRGGWDSLSSTPAGGFIDANRSLPVFSLDSSLLLERDMEFRGAKYLQTLEPRAYYVYIPYKDQSRIPVFDSAQRDESLDQLFTENNYSGIDRINDANQLTLAVTSRFMDMEGGLERLQVTLGQRFYFSDQRVVLPGQAVRSSDITDVVGLVSGQITRQLRVNAGMQIDTEIGSLSKASLGMQWREGPGRVFNAEYRYTDIEGAPANAVNQLDFSAQWPLAPRWYGVGRLNYSLVEDRVVEGLAGFEYNAGCWSLRGMFHKLATSQSSSVNSFFLQLELRGLTKLGPNPLDILKRSISGYAKSDALDLNP